MRRADGAIRQAEHVARLTSVNPRRGHASYSGAIDITTSSMKAAHHIFEYLTAFAVVVLFSAVILFFPEMGQAELSPEVGGINGPATAEQPAAAVAPGTKADTQTNS